MIYSKEEKERLLAKKGMDVLIEHPFTKEFSKLSPRDFVTEVLIKKVGMKILVVGDDCGFGYKRQGNVEFSKEYAERIRF